MIYIHYEFSMSYFVNSFCYIDIDNSSINVVLIRVDITAIEVYELTFIRFTL